MAHRKLQQEIDRVFKKITEGLDIFDTYHKRHEHASNTSQKDKLENDLKREIKKLQKLREQIKVWQTSSDVKDKDKLLEHRRLVEIAMEQYKIIEKGSKVKAYSNTSLKANNDLDPEEKEKLECINFIQESIDELELQYQNCEVELDKLLSKKPSKKNASINELKKDELKEFQSKYRWHQQNLELALRLLENGELIVDDINEIKEDLNYFITNNRDSNFIDNEYLYESLDLDSNEILQHEVVTSFNGLNEKEPTPEPELNQSTSLTTSNNQISPSPIQSSQIPTPIIRSSQSPIPIDTPKKEKFTKKLAVVTTSSSSSSSNNNNHSINGLTSSLKPAITPVKPAQPDIKWSSLVAGLSSDTPSTPTTPVASTTTTATTTATTAPPANITASTTPSQSQLTKKPESIPNEQPSSSPLSTSIKNNNNNNDNDHVQPTESKNINFTSLSNTTTTFTKFDDNSYIQDHTLVSLPPGIQDIILSSYANRVGSFKRQNVSSSTTTTTTTAENLNNGIGSHRMIKNVADSLSLSRYYLSKDLPTHNVESTTTATPSSSQYQIKTNYTKDLSLEFQKCLNDWTKIRMSLRVPVPDVSIDIMGTLKGLTPSEIEKTPLGNKNYNSKILPQVELSTLFYAHFFSMTPYEKKIIDQELFDRGWSITSNGKGFEKSIFQDVDDDSGERQERITTFNVENWSVVESVKKHQIIKQVPRSEQVW